MEYKYRVRVEVKQKVACQPTVNRHKQQHSTFGATTYRQHIG